MVTLKRVVILAIASVLIAAVVRVDRVYGDDLTQRRGGDPYQRRGDDSRQRQWGSEPMPRAGVCFFDDKDFRGKYFCVEPGDELAQLPPGMSDKISSVRVIENVEVVVFKDARFRGPSGRFTSLRIRSTASTSARPLWYPAFHGCALLPPRGRPSGSIASCHSPDDQSVCFVSTNVQVRANTSA